jgi:predicted ATPase
MDILLALRTALGAARGHAPPEVTAVLARIRALSQQIEESPRLFRILISLAFFHLARAELQTGLELLDQCFALAQRLHNPVSLQQTYTRRGIGLWMQGELPHARDDFEQAMTLYDPHQHHHANITTQGTDAGVSCRTFGALVLWFMGYPEQALGRMREALTLARNLSHMLTLATTLNWAAMFHLYRREAREAQNLAEAAIVLATEQGYPQWVAEAKVARGWSLIMQGQPEVGLAQIHQGQAAYQATGTQLLVPQYLALRAEAHANLGHPEEGLTLLNEALAVADKAGLRKEVAEIYRLKGELLLQLSSGHHAAAETCFQKALEVSRNQQARSWELRAAVSLGRLWHQQGKHQDAYDLLAPIYN